MKMLCSAAGSDNKLFIRIHIAVSQNKDQLKLPEGSISWASAAHQLHLRALLLPRISLHRQYLTFQLGPFDRAFSAQLELPWLIALANGAPASAQMCSRLPGREGSSGSLRRKSMKHGGKETGKAQVSEDKLFLGNSPQKINLQR